MSYHYGRGGGEPWRGHGRGGGRDQGGYNQRQVRQRTLSSVDVLTNFFKVALDFNARSRQHTEGYYMYYIEVLDAVRPKQPDGTMEVVEKAKRNPKSATKEHEDLARAIVEQLKTDLWVEGKILASEGFQFGVSPDNLCEQPVSAPVESAEAASTTGQTEAAEAAPTRDFIVRLISDFRFERNNGDRCRELVDFRKNNSWCIVRLKQYDFIPIQEVMNVLESPTTATKGIAVAHCIDTVIRSTMLSTLLAPGKSPRMFYLPPSEHINKDPFRLLSDLQAYYQAGHQKSRLLYQPLVGIRQTTSCVKGQLLLGVDTGMSYFNRDKRVPERRGDRQEAIPVLEDFGNGTFAIAGERITRVPIFDTNVQNKVREALAGIKFHVSYRIERDRDGNQLSEGNIRTNIFRNMKMRAPKRVPGKEDHVDECIFWVANDPTIYTFGWLNDAKEERVTCVYDYYLEKYGIRLRYPNLPLVGTYKGYFPIEFLFTALAKTKNANSDAQKTDALAFNDKFAGNKRIEHITYVRNEVQNLVGSGAPPTLVLERFNLRLATEPIAMTAKVLTPPTLMFAQNSERHPDKGSWNLKDVKFHTPSTLNSFAVVDLTGGSSKTVLSALFKNMEGHGMELPINIDREEALAHVTVQCRDGRDFQRLHDAVKQAIHQARNYFLTCEPSRIIGFHTLAPILYDSKIGSTEKCCAFQAPGGKIGLVLNPRFENGQPAFADSRWPSHDVELANGTTVKARCCIAVAVVTTGEKVNLDPFDIVWSARKYQGYHNNVWQDVRPEGLAYNVFNGTKPEAVVGARAANWIRLVDPWQVECPAIVFMCLQDKETAPYRALKFLTNAQFGVQSQCLVKAKYANPKVGGYLSNVSLKLNTKLANSWSDARAWTSDSAHSLNNVPWLSEVPTLVIGLSLSHSTSGWSAVVASVCLDNCQLTDRDGGFMQMGHEVKLISKPKADFIAKSTMKELVMSLAYQYSRRELPGPALRVIFFRDGGADGSFENIKAEELEGIKLAFTEVNAVLNTGCEHCASRVCTAHMPQVTYIVAQSDHGIRIVPNFQGGRRDDRAATQNVPFGTCVDHTIVSCSDGNPNFLLIAQHGLKGTSRGVLYKVLVNENDHVPDYLCGKCTALTPEILQKLTFNMSFHYGTATKSVRQVPVVLYSKRLAEQIISYLNYLQQENLAREPGTEDELKIFNRTDRELEFDIPMLRNGMLPGFGPFEPRLANGSIPMDGETDEREKSYLFHSLRNPFRPHLAA